MRTLSLLFITVLCVTGEDPKVKPVPSISDKDRAAFYLASVRKAQAQLAEIELQKRLDADIARAAEAITASCPGVQIDTTGVLICPADPTSKP